MSEKIAIVGCKMLEDEIVYLLNNDSEIKEAIIQKRKNNSYKEFESKLEIKTKVTNLDKSFNIKSDAIIELLPFALHEEPEKLRNKVKKSIKRISRYSEEILIFYGLCGNTFDNFEKLKKEVNANLTILKKEKELLDDCICLTLNGNENYLENIKEEAGTFFLTPMWAENWKDMFKRCKICSNTNNLDLIKYVFDKSGYTRVLKLNTGLRDNEKFDKKVREFANKLNLKLQERECKNYLNLIKENYIRYKRKLS